MARERMGYHLTPEGPKPCSARKGKCPYGQHFSTEINAQIAFRNEEKLLEAVRIKKELSAAAHRWEGPDVLQIRPEHNILDSDDSARRFAIIARQHALETGQDPANITVRARTTLAGAGDSEGDWEFRITRKPKVDGDILKIKGDWTVEWWSKKDWGYNDPSADALVRAGRPTPKRYFTHTFPVAEETITLASFHDFHNEVYSTVGTHSAFRSEAGRSDAPASADEAVASRKERVRDFTSRFTSLIKAAETESLGPYQASLHGVGPYDSALNRGGDFQLETTFRKSSVTGPMLEKLAQDDDFFTKGPRLTAATTHITVSHEAAQGDTWVIRHSPREGWALDTYESPDAPGERYSVRTPEEARATLRSWMESRQGPEAAAKRDRWEGRYIEDLMAGTEAAFKATDAKQAGASRAASVEALHRQAFLADAAEEKSGFGKIFSLFG